MLFLESLYRAGEMPWVGRDAVYGAAWQEEKGEAIGRRGVPKGVRVGDLCESLLFSPK